MIISREYDDALWCMLFAEKKNREEILEFITELPQEVLDYARSLAKQRSEFLETDDVFDDDEDFEDDEDDMVLGFFNSRTDPSIEYYVNIEEDDGSITIEKSRKTKQLNKKGMEITEYEQLFELIILPMNQEKIDSLEDLDFDDSVGWIGTITTNKEKEYDYDLRERDANLYIRRTRLLLGDRVEVPSYTKLNLNDLPHELDRGNMTRALKQKNKK